ncbi:MAG: ParB/RepB/Spo0J family partition protein, partial [Elusimicrobiota bacterium]
MMPETNIKHIMRKKLGDLISLPIDKIQISEFNTRCQFVDHDHVETLMKSIETNGYIPKSAVWVNAVIGPDEKIIAYRLVAGRHRYEATKRLNLEEIP